MCFKTVCKQLEKIFNSSIMQQLDSVTKILQKTAKVYKGAQVCVQVGKMC